MDPCPNARFSVGVLEKALDWGSLHGEHVFPAALGGVHVVSETDGRGYKGAQESALRYHVTHPLIVERRMEKLRTVRQW